MDFLAADNFVLITQSQFHIHDHLEQKIFYNELLAISKYGIMNTVQMLIVSPLNFRTGQDIKVGQNLCKKESFSVLFDAKTNSYTSLVAISFFINKQLQSRSFVTFCRKNILNSITSTLLNYDDRLRSH